MFVHQALRRTRALSIPRTARPVEETAAREIQSVTEGAALVRESGRRGRPARGIFHVAVADAARRKRLAAWGVKIPGDREWIVLHIEEDGSGFLWSSTANFLFTGARHLLEELAGEDVAKVRSRVIPLTFAVEKSTFDVLLTQYGRIIRPFDRERYIREYARLGFSHIEVNALAAPFPVEPGVPDEFYSDFYTYCPALDQFVASSLNRGFYPKEHLDANLNVLKENTRSALRYGLTPGLLCFEPRSMPEDFFRRYPTLRGPRVDHPFRSFKPRYALTLVHPAARAHYAELVANLLAEVPELGFMAVWSNDSGSGFEHTKSLYVGRNGGPYLVREWKDDEEIARLAAENVARFYRLIRDAAEPVHPGFRVITRLESFYGERRHLWPLLRDRLDVEVNSLLTTGWENNYPHPTYKDIPVLGSLYHNTLAAKESSAAAELAGRGSRAHFFHYFASFGNFEPLLGIPFPWLTHDKLRAASERGVQALAWVGGLHPPDKAPFSVNQDVFRAFQLDCGLDINEAILRIAEGYAGRRGAGRLVRGWRFLEAAIRKFAPLPLYSGYGTVWNRLLVRPLAPDIDAIPEAAREYYEKVMVSPIHNPNKVDLAKDVLFDIVPTAYAEKARRRIDRGVRQPLGRAIAVFEAGLERAKKEGDGKASEAFRDQRDRTLALRCFFETLRNAAAWIAAVHGYLGTKNAAQKARHRDLLDKAISREIDNTEALIDLWRDSPVEWMMVSAVGETPFIYGENFPELLRRKIVLMKKHRRDDPAIDPEYMFRV